MTIDASEFRRILGHWPTGVGVVTACGADGRPGGLTANAIASVSLEPPLVLVCVDLRADTHAAIREGRAFAINVLPATAESLARRFAGGGRADKFEGVAWRSGGNGMPVLAEALAWAECTLEAAWAGGDHTIFVGRVTGGDARPGEPLLFFRGGYGRAGL
jgi:flavin reductase (DIM6/NTAB) family NADH-FMN oxidoreductase RutF